MADTNCCEITRRQATLQNWTYQEFHDTTKARAYLRSGVGAVVTCLTEQVALAIGPPVARESPVRNHSPLVCPPTPHLRPHLVCIWCAPPVTRHVLMSLCCRLTHSAAVSLCCVAWPTMVGWCKHSNRIVGWHWKLTSRWMCLCMHPGVHWSSVWLTCFHTSWGGGPVRP